MQIDPTHVLVTGGAGFIGSHIVDLLIENHFQVTVVDNLSTGRREQVHQKARFVEMDITSPDLGAIFRETPFYAVIHQAAQATVPLSLADPLFDQHVNITGTLNLLECSRYSGTQRFVIASSAAVYGDPEHIPLKESDPTRPLSPYGLSKLTAERYTWLYHTLFGLETFILRYANVYGPRQNTQGEAGVICLFITQLLQREQPVIHGDGLQSRDFVYVSDIARSNLLALACDAQPGIYNVGTSKATSISQLFRLLSKGRTGALHTPPRSGDIRHSVLDASAIRKVLNWQPIFPLPEGLERTIAYFQANP